MHRYDTENERGWERGREGRREFDDMRESWRGYEGRGQGRRDYDYDRERRENQGYGDQGSWGQPYSNEYRSQDWGRQYGNRESFGRNREFEDNEFRGGMNLHHNSPYYGQQYGGIGGQQQQQRGRFAGKGPRGYQRSDQRIQEEVNDRLTDHPEIDASEIEVKVSNGEVTLSGSVNERFQKRMAEDLVENIGGVKQVHNQIRVQHEMGTGTQGQQSQQRKTASSESTQQQELTGTGSSPALRRRILRGGHAVALTPNTSAPHSSILTVVTDAGSIRIRNDRSKGIPR